MRQYILLSKCLKFCVCWVEQSLTLKKGLNLRKVGEEEEFLKRRRKIQKRKKEIMEENRVDTGRQPVIPLPSLQKR